MESGVVPQAGTGPGVLVGPASLSPVDDFYRDYYVVNTDTTPSNGLVSQYARVSSYVGATRTFTLDKPIDLSAESDVALVLPARVWLYQDVTENLVISKSVELNLQGHRIEGTVDVAGGIFQWIRGGSGYVTNGIEKTNFGCLQVEDCDVSRRGATIYALLMTNGSNLGRCDLKNCRFDGRVAGRRGYSGWGIKDCTGLGVSSSGGFSNLPFTLVESIPGVAIVLTALDAELDTEFGGAILYSENLIIGVGAYISILGGIRAITSYMEQEPTPRNFSFVRASGAGVITVTQATGYKNLTIRDFIWIGNNTRQQPMASYVSAESLTGSLTFTDNIGANLPMSDCQIWNDVLIEGSSPTSGTVTLAGSGVLFFPTVDPTFRLVTLDGALTGSVVHSIAFLNISGGDVSMISYDADQTSGAPAVTISTPTVQHLGGTGFRVVRIVGNVSVGTYTYSCAFQGGNLSQIYDGVFSLPANVSGGAWNFSGNFGLEYADATQQSIIFIKAAGTGGSVTFSGQMAVYKPSESANAGNTLRIVENNASGGTLLISGALTMGGFGCISTFILVRATVSGGTASITGAVVATSFLIQGAVTICNPNIAGSTVAGPSSISFQQCTFLSTFTNQSGSGTLTWTGATLFFRQCHIEDLFTINGDNFAALEAFHTRFNGNSGNQSVSLGGARPAIHRYWKCSFQAIMSLTAQADIIDDYNTLPAQAALTQGQPVFINNARQYQVCVAGSIVDGVLLAAAAGAGNPAVCVKSGRVYVNAKAGTASGDNLALDLATPTQANLAVFTPGQNIGTALEAVGTVIAGKCYTAVNMR